MGLTGLNLDDFAARLAGADPTPGGGSVAALAGALSSCLCAMVARLTEGREKYRAAWTDMERVRQEADRLTARLMNLVDLDTEAYNRVLAAFKLPRENEQQQAARRQAVQEATLEAAAVPLETLKAVSRLTGLVRLALDKGNPNCVTDAGVAAQMIRAAAAGAAYNVRINLSGVKDRARVEEMGRQTSELLAHVNQEAVRLEEMVEDRL